MEQPEQDLPVVAIIGAGIAGLAAAFFLRDEPVRVVVLEGSRQTGGKLSLAEVAGCRVDVGAEALLARRPEGTGLVRAAGLGDDLRSPGTTAARIWSRGAMHRLPARQYMGVPADIGELGQTGLLSAEGLERAGREPGLAPTHRDGDVSVQGYVAARFGQEIVDRLVDPLLGGVYAGRSEELSFEATLPGLAQASRTHASLAGAAASLLPPPPPDLPPAGRSAPAGGPPASPARPAVFTTLAGGLGTLPPALAAASGAEVRTGAMVRELVRTPRGWRLTIGSAHAPQYLDADAVILALPGRPASRLLGGVPGAAAAAAALGEISYASMAIVTLAYPDTAFPQLPEGSGYLVPAVDGRPVKAVTFSSVKWPHLRGPRGRAGLRALLGRPHRRGSHPAAGRWRARCPGRRRPGRRDRGPGRPGRRPGHPVGRRPAAVHGRAPGPGRPDPGRPRGPARPGGLRRRLRGGGHSRVHRDRAGRGGSGHGRAPGRHIR